MPTIDERQLELELRSLAAFVVNERGLRFVQPVYSLLLDEEEFGDRLMEQFSPEDLEAQGRLLGALGLLPPGEDFARRLRALLVSSVPAFYSADANAVIVKRRPLTNDLRQALVHELTHALDDQHFTLSRPEYASRKDEVAFGLRALAEGDARRIERRWHDQFNPGAPFDLTPPSLDQQTDPNGDPAIVVSQTIETYVLGEALVNDILERSGPSGLDSAFVTPPTTSEQVIHPEKFAAREPRIEVEPPPYQGSKIRDGVLGELLTRQLLESRIGRERALVAAAGWGGDWFVEYSDDDGQSCFRIDWRMDSQNDLDELAAALDAWKQAGGVGDIERPDGETLRLTNCLPPPPSGGGTSPL
ncbi:MAG: hypothetical protein N2037_01925 [Acidimicrobiales bacterium]|nr:hypothetical protein [Acidimicrobiales bacterium]